MIAEVISIGDELTSGQRLDTNSQWLSQQLGDLGIHVRYHTTVADDLDANVRVFRAAVDRADIVVSSGGLGPTADDLTRDSLAQVAGVPLVLDEPSLAHIRGLFARHNREMPERNRLQAMFPQGAQAIFNANGTAPGIDIPVRRADGSGSARVFALPGVPAEMFEMFASWVAPTLLSLQPEPRVIRHRRIKCFGAGESQIEQMLPDLIRRGRQPSVGITVHAATITLRITAEGRAPEDCYAVMQPTIATIHDSLGSLVFGEEDDELEDVVTRLLGDRHKTLATVEAGTGGLLAQWLTAAAKAQPSAYLGGVVLSNSIAVPGVLGGEAHKWQAAATSEDFARAAAASCRAQFAADYALSIGFFPEDAGGTSGTAPPYYFALATPDKVMRHAGTLISHPSIWRPRAAKQALNLLRLRLIERE